MSVLKGDCRLNCIYTPPSKYLHPNQGITSLLEKYDKRRYHNVIKNAIKFVKEQFVCISPD